ncbi:MAG: lipoyl synthase [Chloroflexi bacterium]|nr:lipoyl synthase [Chloroflexota bacterium]MCH9036597.1 lipoyl synthase [Chloroflexota bacterium]
MISTAETRTPERRPPWLKVRLRTGPNYLELKSLMRKMALNTVCEEAHCPNIFECWQNRTATFMILGDVCTRACRFCAVTSGKPTWHDLGEPERVARAVEKMKLAHAVVTSVARDDLEDGGASVFAATIRKIREYNPKTRIEVLIPDFQGSESALDKVMTATPDILNHNIETVERLQRVVRSRARYDRSLELLRRAKEKAPEGLTKSGMMMGVGETVEEVLQAMADLRQVGCNILTIGQYLRPSEKHLPITRYYTPEEFKELKEEGLKMGFRHVESGPLVRSSYHAHEHV